MFPPSVERAAHQFPVIKTKFPLFAAAGSEVIEVAPKFTGFDSKSIGASIAVCELKLLFDCFFKGRSVF